MGIDINKLKIANELINKNDKIKRHAPDYIDPSAPNHITKDTISIDIDDNEESEENSLIDSIDSYLNEKCSLDFPDISYDTVHEKIMEIKQYCNSIKTSLQMQIKNVDSKINELVEIFALAVPIANYKEYRTDKETGAQYTVNHKGELHSWDDRPSWMHNGNLKWHRNGKLHRADGPARIDSNGYSVHYKNGSTSMNSHMKNSVEPNRNKNKIKTTKERENK